ncbi:hypothetical protein [Hyalangium sp.]|uniref:hypothetical protein n=1 Tax=Hyalangium sp. TaxID=2028555 RepID=UPI002D72E767|nr:hypothetical protein [Hyalangium sp.]HYH97829.1 hypothetical protein [Hyalangium sp.]
MGHLFVPAALALWVAVAVVRALATPATAPAPAVEVKVQQLRPVEAAGKSVSEADRAQPAVHGEG